MSTPTRRIMRNTFPAEQSASDLSRALTEWLERAGPRDLYRTCASCRHISQGNEPARCGLFNTTPPVDVILAGCDSYADEAEIPS